MAPTIQTLSDEVGLRKSLAATARQGDWDGLMAALDELSRITIPQQSAALHDRARALEDSLVAARATRADLAASLVRFTAAGKFAVCQDSAESPNF